MRLFYLGRLRPETVFRLFIAIVQESREKESQGWAEAETGHFPECRGSEKGQRTEGPRVSGIRTGKVAKGQKVQLILEKISTMWSFDAQGYCPVTKP